MAKGHRIGSISHLSPPYLENLCFQDEAPNESSTSNIKCEVFHLLQLIKNYELKSIHSHMKRMRLNMSPEDFLLSIVVPILQFIGKQVASGHLSIAQEHAMSAIIKEHLIHLSSIEGPGQNTEQRVAFCTPNGDRHEFGILIAYVLCKLQGFYCQYLGTDLMAGALVDAAIAMETDILVIGSTNNGRPDFKSNLRVFLMDLYQGFLGHPKTIWLGGSGFALVPSLCKRLGMLKIDSLEELAAKILTTEQQQHLH